MLEPTQADNKRQKKITININLDNLIALNLVSKIARKKKKFGKEKD